MKTLIKYNAMIVLKDVHTEDELIEWLKTHKGDSDEENNIRGMSDTLAGKENQKAG
jgi:hypothetical protein